MFVRASDVVAAMEATRAFVNECFGKASIAYACVKYVLCSALQLD